MLFRVISKPLLKEALELPLSLSGNYVPWSKSRIASLRVRDHMKRKRDRKRER